MKDNDTKDDTMDLVLWFACLAALAASGWFAGGIVYMWLN